MKTFQLLLREPSEEETKFRVSRFDAVLCRIPEAIKPKYPRRYIAEYACLTSLWKWSAEKVEDWAKKRRVDPEKLFLHREGDAPPAERRAKDPENRYMMNFGDNDYREWIVHAAKDHVSGVFYFGKEHKRPCNGILYDLPIWYASSDWGRSQDTIEYKDNPVAHAMHSAECVAVLQNRCDFDIIPNLTHIMYGTKDLVKDVMTASGSSACLFEIGVDLNNEPKWRGQRDQLVAFCRKWPDHRKFIGIRGGTFEQAAVIASYLDAVAPNVWVGHIRNVEGGGDANLQRTNIRDWAFNPLLEIDPWSSWHISGEPCRPASKPNRKSS